MQSFSAQQIFEAEKKIQMIIDLTPTIVEEYAARAALKREKFKALKAEGFTDEQAMQIIVAGGTNLDL